MVKHFYKDIWFWLFTILLIIGGSLCFYKINNPNTIAQKVNSKITLGSTQFGSGGSSYDEVKKVLGKPNKEEFPDASEVKSSKKLDSPIESVAIWEDDNDKTAVVIEFASESGKKSDMKAVATMNMNQAYAAKHGFID